MDFEIAKGFAERKVAIERHRSVAKLALTDDVLKVEPAKTPSETAPLDRFNALGQRISALLGYSETVYRKNDSNYRKGSVSKFARFLENSNDALCLTLVVTYSSPLAEPALERVKSIDALWGVVSRELDESDRFLAREQLSLQQLQPGVNGTGNPDAIRVLGLLEESVSVADAVNKQQG